MSSSSTSKGKSKAKSPTAGKRKLSVELSLEEKIEVVTKKIARHEGIVEAAHLELDGLKIQLKRKQRLDDFIKTMTSDSCVICSRDLSECIGEPNMGLVSYECECNRPRLVHLGCFTREFRCCCSVFAKIDLKSSAGKSVNVTVSEVVTLEDVLASNGGVSLDDGAHDSDYE